MPAPEIVKISYNAIPPGQVGDRPQKIHGSFVLQSLDPGELQIEFKDRSPLKNNEMFVKAGPAAVEVVHPGIFKFKCHLKRPDGTVVDLDPDDPHLPGGGGSMEVVPDPSIG